MSADNTATSKFNRTLGHDADLTGLGDSKESRIPAPLKFGVPRWVEEKNTDTRHKTTPKWPAGGTSGTLPRLLYPGSNCSGEFSN